jgi:ABC-type cobalamin transport system permease subunit
MMLTRSTAIATTVAVVVEAVLITTIVVRVARRNITIIKRSRRCGVEY